jgi:hypothetical protein
MNRNEISFNTRQPEAIRTRTDFIYHMGPNWITIADTGKGKCSVADDLESVLRKIEYWHQGPITKFKIMCRDGKGFWPKVQWDSKTASLFALEETDEPLTLLCSTSFTFWY